LAAMSSFLPSILRVVPVVAVHGAHGYHCPRWLCQSSWCLSLNARRNASGSGLLWCAGGSRFSSHFLHSFRFSSNGHSGVARKSLDRESVRTACWRRTRDCSCFARHKRRSDISPCLQGRIGGIGRRLELLPIHGMDMGVASDVNVYTFTRFAVRIGLLGRPRPHSRRSLQTASRGLCHNGVPLV
jgi:hypothetical protein